MKTLAFVLAAFLLAIQAQLWFGKGGLGHVAQLRTQLRVATAANAQARAQNTQIEAELRDLREGLEMVEEKARFELGLIKPDEIYVHIEK